MSTAVPGKQDLGPDVPTPKAEAKGGAQSGGESVNADAAWREKPPAPGPSVALHLPVPEQFKLSNGLTVLYNDRPGLPLVAASLVFRRGSGANPIDQPGLASFTARMLQQGSTTRSALQIADRAADLGTTIESRASLDSSRIGTEALTRNFPDILELLADVVLHPTFPQRKSIACGPSVWRRWCKKRRAVLCRYASSTPRRCTGRNIPTVTRTLAPRTL